MLFDEFALKKSSDFCDNLVDERMGIRYHKESIKIKPQRIKRIDLEAKTRSLP